jgi:hypothetical protein
MTEKQTPAEKAYEANAQLPLPLSVYQEVWASIYAGVEHGDYELPEALERYKAWSDTYRISTLGRLAVE